MKKTSRNWLIALASILAGGGLLYFNYKRTKREDEETREEAKDSLVEDYGLSKKEAEEIVEENKAISIAYLAKKLAKTEKYSISDDLLNLHVASEAENVIHVISDSDGGTSIVLRVPNFVNKKDLPGISDYMRGISSFMEAWKDEDLKKPLRKLLRVYLMIRWTDKEGIEQTDTFLCPSWVFEKEFGNEMNDGCKDFYISLMKTKGISEGVDERIREFLSERNSSAAEGFTIYGAFLGIEITTAPKGENLSPEEVAFIVKDIVDHEFFFKGVGKESFTYDHVVYHGLYEGYGTFSLAYTESSEMEDFDPKQ